MSARIATITRIEPTQRGASARLWVDVCLHDELVGSVMVMSAPRDDVAAVASGEATLQDIRERRVRHGA